ncbi:hypothetical protein LDC_1194 [sediment metagenome]|uniref:Uncharacterized protein n=1 Tax=sediment metagenome TaxID=749907 RepID=D9PI40_9ZZZZ
MRTLLQTFFFILLVTQIYFAQWHQQNEETLTLLEGVYFYNQSIGWAVGEDGTILYTNDAGLTWLSQTSGVTNWLFDVQFTDANTGWVVGDYGTILHTTDGGVTWFSQTSGTTYCLFHLHFADTNIGWAVGGTGFVGKTILYTTDGGTMWLSQINDTTHPRQQFTSVYFINDSKGWVVGGNGTILHTTDSGRTWTSLISGTTFYLCDVYFTDESTGWVVGDNGTILHTLDGGTTWLPQTSGTMNRLSGIYFSDADIGWAVGDHILHTSDGGKTWLNQFSGAWWLSDVHFTDANTGWSVGHAVILHTTNGGVVPVELNSFTATSKGKEVTLNWSTATELNNYGFEIQRKTSAGEFSTVAFVKGYGTTTQKKDYSFVDKNLDAGKYSYRLKQVDLDSKFEYSKVVEVEVISITSYLLEQNYPNPFNPSTTITYTLKEKSDVKLTLLNSLGEEVAVLVNEEQNRGYYNVEFDGSKLTSGVYFYQLKAVNPESSSGQAFVEIKKMILLR